MTTHTAETEAAMAQRALVRSAAYEALSLACSYPQQGSDERLRGLLEDLAEHPLTAELGLLASVTELAAALAAADPLARAAEYTRLFDNAMLCAPFETDYQPDPFAKASQLADVAGFYRAWGVDVARARPTTPDFVGSELEFMSLLTRKQAYAEACGWGDQDAIARRAQRAFLEDHLGRWVPAFAAAVNEHAGSGAAGRYFATLAAASARLVAGDVAAFGARPVPLRSRMVGEEAPLDCPLAPAPDEPDLIPLDDIEVEPPRGRAARKVDPES
jgi:TorA maturation chaperone TorD